LLVAGPAAATTAGGQHQRGRYARSG